MAACLWFFMLRCECARVDGYCSRALEMLGAFSTTSWWSARSRYQVVKTNDRKCIRWEKSAVRIAPSALSSLMSTDLLFVDLACGKKIGRFLFKCAGSFLFRVWLSVSRMNVISSVSSANGGVTWSALGKATQSESQLHAQKSQLHTAQCQVRTSRKSRVLWVDLGRGLVPNPDSP